MELFEYIIDSTKLTAVFNSGDPSLAERFMKLSSMVVPDLRSAQFMTVRYRAHIYLYTP